MPDDEDTGAARRVVLHIGLHKTGTTYLQRLWAANRRALAKQGVYFAAGKGQPVQRLAAKDLLGHRPRGTSDPRLVGQWDALCAAVLASPRSTGLVSAEGLSVADRRQAAAAVAGFPGIEVHVLVTCRDLGRSLVSSWQEDVKNDRTWTWAEYVAAVRDPAARGRSPARRFWLTQDLPTILGTWGAAVPARQIHVVTVPPPGAAPTELLARVADVVGFAPESMVKAPAWDNTSLGVAGTEVVRRLNLVLDHRLDQRQHDHVVKTLLVPSLVRAGTDARYALPADDLVWVREEAGRQVDAVRAGRYVVHGDLADLVPRADPAARRPDEVSEAELVDAAVVALAGLAERNATLWSGRHEGERPVIEPGGLTVRARSAVRGARFRSRRAVAALADRSALVGRIAGAYVSRRER